MTDKRIKLFKEAKNQCHLLLVQFPKLPTIQSILNQLEYLIDLESGVSKDRSRLREIIIGIQTAREIEPLDMNVAHLLYEVSDEASRM